MEVILNMVKITTLTSNCVYNLTLFIDLAAVGDKNHFHESKVCEVNNLS